MVTIYKNIFDKNPHYKPVDLMLNRIKKGASKKMIDEIRGTIDEEKQKNLKCYLPSVCFGGKFGADRTDESILEYSNLITLDFDYCEDAVSKRNELSKLDFIYSTWISPRGNGVKALVKITSGERHKQHFEALLDRFPELDRSGANIARVCFESYDPDIYINNKSKVWNEIIEHKQEIIDIKNDDEISVFQNILKWLTNKGDAFVSGERNVFVFKLASACCRFGINETDCYNYCLLSLHDSTFTNSELKRTIRSAYKSSKNAFNSAEFVNQRLVDKTTKKEIKSEIDPDIYNVDIKPKDVIFGEDVINQALNIYDNGYDKVDGIGVYELDSHFKYKKGEITLLSGIGNYGKSAFLKWFILMRIVKFGDKFALFAPEDNPAEEFYHDMVEIYLGADCTPYNNDRPPRNVYLEIYKLISSHVFYVYPKEISPTPTYIKERFLELIIKEKINGCIIDPFNQMTNDYNKSGGRSDKYLETFLADCSRFAQQNNVYFTIVAHPKLMRKQDDGNYPCPDVFDIADGAMWNNKMDNILVYNRPNHQNNPNGTECELHTKKIRRQKTVGKKGVVEFDYARKVRRYYFNNIDPLGELIGDIKEIEFKPDKIDEIPF